jgi:hypothetical protein
MASTMYEDDFRLAFHDLKFYFDLDIRRIKSLVCQFVSPLDAQTLPVCIYLFMKIKSLNSLYH